MSILSRPRRGNAVKHFEAGSGTRQSSLAGHRSGNSGESHYENASQRWRKGTNQSHRRKGQALIEFAFVSIVMVTLFTVAFSLGLMLLQSMVTANAGTSAGRILHHHPRLSPEAFAWMRTNGGLGLPFDVANPSATEIMELITSQNLDFMNEFGPHLYDETLLIITTDDYRNANFREQLPLLNQLLMPHYLYDPDLDVGTDEKYVRYPGAIVRRTSDNKRTVLIPLVGDPVSLGFDNGDCDDECSRTTYWLPPLRISKISNVCDCNQDVPVMPPLIADGEFAVTIAFPAQAGSLVEFVPVRDAAGNPTENEFGEVRERVAANDSVLTQLNTLPTGYELASVNPENYNPEFASAPMRGDYGLGELEVLRPLDDDDPRRPGIRFEPINVRPYRRVIEHSSTFRLGQRFEAMYQLSGTDSVALSPIPSITALEPMPSANNFLLTSRVYDDAELFADSTSAAATIPVTGKWRVTASVQLELPTPPTPRAIPWSLELRLYRNGNFDPSNGLIAVGTFPADFDGPFKLTGSTLVDATALIGNEDTLEVRIWQNSGVDLDIVDSQEANWTSLEANFLSK